MTKTNIGTATVTDGTATTTYTIPSDTTPGVHTIYATYIENDNFMEAVGYNTAEIRIHTNTTVNDVLASIGETATFIANVTYNTNNNVDEGQVQFKLAGTNIGSPVNVSNGVATLQYEIPSNTIDGTEITATFIETNTYGASTSTAGTLNIRGSSNVVIQNVSANRDTTATITATITDSDGNNINEGEAQLYIDNTIIGQPITVNNGAVSFEYEVANNAVLGGHSIKVIFSEATNYDASEGTATLTIRTPTTLTPVNVSGNKGVTVPVTIRVTDPNITAITEGTVNITVGDNTAISATVGNTGEASIQYDIPEDATGTITFTGEYVENTNYQGSTSINGIITVRKETTIVVDSVKAELGDEINLSSVVTDEDSNVVTEGTVNYEIE